MYQKVFKRIIDLLIALMALPFVLIMAVPVAVAIKLEDRGNVLFRGTRLGYRLKPFKMYKFRSMAVDASDIRNADGSTYNSDDDPRITRIGKKIRKASIDELPQIVNVVLGQMSLVGPRPSPLGNVESYDADYMRKFNVLPGITGYNQAYFRNSLSADQKQKNDLFYVDHVTLLLDIKIILKTISAVLARKNIYTTIDMDFIDDVEAINIVEAGNRLLQNEKVNAL